MTKQNKNTPFNELQTETEEQEIGRFGRQWRRFMEETYPLQASMMKTFGKDWELIPRRIDKQAQELYETVREEYQRTNPRPSAFAELAVWEETFRMMWIHRVETELIYLPWDDELSDINPENYPF